MWPTAQASINRPIIIPKIKPNTIAKIISHFSIKLSSPVGKRAGLQIKNVSRPLFNFSKSNGLVKIANLGPKFPPFSAPETARHLYSKLSLEKIVSYFFYYFSQHFLVVFHQSRWPSLNALQKKRVDKTISNAISSVISGWYLSFI